ncbi:hypothetical protein [Maribellus maritimus]|nr:hypothetical protein [Maribellus maritimus]MCG6191610.1 hypothetical protein [Maribellus maritimus]
MRRCELKIFSDYYIISNHLPLANSGTPDQEEKRSGTGRREKSDEQ